MLQSILRAIQVWLLNHAWAELQKWAKKLVVRLLTNETSREWAREQGRILGQQLRVQIPGDVSEPLVAAFFEGIAEGVLGEVDVAKAEGN